MRYHEEKLVASSQPTWLQVIRWLVSFPGYIILLFSWVGIVATVCAALISLLFAPNTSQQLSHSYPPENIGTGSDLNPLVAMLLVILTIICIVTLYGLIVRYTASLVNRLAEYINLSVWLVKVLGIIVGCGLSAGAAIILWSRFDQQILIGAIVCGIIGLLSFGLEYYCLRAVFSQRLH